MTVAQLLAAALARRGVARIFGVPGGGSSLDVIRACRERGIAFVLARTETAACIMAAVTAELGGGIGVALTTQGPGTASAANGVAYASLDRAPLVVITDGWPASKAFDTHQRFDQQAMFAPVVKGHGRLEGDDPGADIERLFELAATAPYGPVHIELTGECARREVAAPVAPAPAPAQPPVPAAPIVRARELIGAARKPVILVGLEAKTAPVTAALAEFVRGLACPVLTTYKAKGAIPDTSAQFVGLFTAALIEQECVRQADLIILVGLDPVELIGRPWPYQAPVLDLAAVRHPTHHVEPAAGVYGDLASILTALRGSNSASDWRAAEIAGLHANVARGLVNDASGDGLAPDVVLLEAVAANGSARATVDAGAHMLSAMALWPAAQPGDVSISNGLSTMAYAVPAAIATVLQRPDRMVFAFTGDGGLMMCAGELSTAVEEKARICVVVFNDGLLSLIEIKQKARGLPREGVGWQRPDFAKVAEGFGMAGFRATTLAEYRAALKSAIAIDGPSLVDVHVNPTGYADQLVAQRG